MVLVEVVMQHADNIGVEAILEREHDDRRHYHSHFLPCR
jgi:hypothetical protein